tara:strand:+ start:1275 stop:1481 length:207 start_codon:yes stop_codon:yes gene_type:complete
MRNLKILGYDDCGQYSDATPLAGEEFLLLSVDYVGADFEALRALVSALQALSPDSPQRLSVSLDVYNY